MVKFHFLPLSPKCFHFSGPRLNQILFPNESNANMMFERLLSKSSCCFGPVLWQTVLNLRQGTQRYTLGIRSTGDQAVPVRLYFSEVPNRWGSSMLSIHACKSYL